MIILTFLKLENQDNYFLQFVLLSLQKNTEEMRTDRGHELKFLHVGVLGQIFLMACQSLKDFLNF